MKYKVASRLEDQIGTQAALDGIRTSVPKTQIVSPPSALSGRSPALLWPSCSRAFQRSAA